MKKYSVILFLIILASCFDTDDALNLQSPFTINIDGTDIGIKSSYVGRLSTEYEYKNKALNDPNIPFYEKIGAEIIPSSRFGFALFLSDIQMPDSSLNTVNLTNGAKVVKIAIVMDKSEKGFATSLNRQGNPSYVSLAGYDNYTYYSNKTEKERFYSINIVKDGADFYADLFLDAAECFNNNKSQKVDIRIKPQRIKLKLNSAQYAFADSTFSLN